MPGLSCVFFEKIRIVRLSLQCYLQEMTSNDLRLVACWHPTAIGVAFCFACASKPHWKSRKELNMNNPHETNNSIIVTLFFACWPGNSIIQTLVTWYADPRLVWLSAIQQNERGM